ncbi:MAG: DUF87 domain-containing protein [Roseburia sp.]|nr:DUF87 domain-containing protein [Roseburia sp.]
MDTNLAEIQDYKKLALSMETAKDIVTKSYLYQLDSCEAEKLSENLEGLDIAEYTRFYKFRKMVSDKKESTLDKLVTVLNSAYTSNATVITLISGRKEFTDYYLGVISKDISQQSENIETQGETLKGVLTGNFPGLEIEPIKGDEKKALIENTFQYEYITAISGIASVRNKKENNYEKFVQGIEHLVDSFQGRVYNVVLIADPVRSGDIVQTRMGYENLYTQLSPFLKTGMTFSESENIGVSRSHTDGISKTISESTALTQNYSKTSGWSESSNQGTSKNRDIGRLVGSVVGAGLGVAATVLTGGAAAPAVVAAMYAGSNIGGTVGGSLIGSQGENEGQSVTESGSITDSSGKTATKSVSEGNQSSETVGQTEGQSQGKTIQFSNENQTVKNILSMIEQHIKRLQECDAYGAFNCAAYVVSSDPETNAIVANGYNALMRGDNSALQASHINSWNASEPNGQEVMKYLKKFSHPLFRDGRSDNILISPASIVNSYELAVSMGMPKKSINGLPVYEMASFGRNVFELNQKNDGRAHIHLGQIFHMGVKSSTEVNLDLKSLAMHTFITGSTGSGKSNTVYQLLRELKKQNIHYLVVEPAKGEYKHIFGNEGAKVYGTNPYYTALLKVNPFKFPDGIHVLEHIDRLIEIFNVCWPMYAAMPAVLKDSVEKAYISAGWDLNTSENRYGEAIYPTFVDVLTQLDIVVENSGFSQEVKDNYIGSLSTRIKSLTNGIYGRIFSGDETGDISLFDQDVIVDLSRVGSVETKSMIMGILVMRLQEYRMMSGEMDADLKHVTVLEEAHNLLKRTSTEQSGESANLLGKSVEMLSNAIAEVRTYGEGFIIADQAPGLLDLSVIRNTNTKIIMRLPDAEDRSLVGKAANLSEEQILELSKLPTGVAAVYQNNWLEPILCQVEYKKTEGRYLQPEKNTEDTGKYNIILKALLNKTAGEKLDYNLSELTRMVLGLNISTKAKIEVISALKKRCSGELSEISEVIYNMVYDEEILGQAWEAESIDEWKDILLYSEKLGLNELEEKQQLEVVECILREQTKMSDDPQRYMDMWEQYKRGVVF